MADTTPVTGAHTWTKLRQRKVVQWGLGYVAVAWGLLQGLEFAVTTFAWPATVTRVGAVLAVVGALVTMTLAWFHGDRGEQRMPRLEIIILAGLLVIGAVVAREVAQGAKGGQPASVHAQTAHPAAATAAERRRVAILPFENLGGDPANSAFVGGVHDTLITQVAKVPGLFVISRSSVLQFAGQHPTIRQVADALGVGAVLEGSVQRDGKRLRIQAQLIDAATDAHLWAESYDRDAGDLFAVQSEIALAVAEQLRIRLADTDSTRLARSLTSKPAAYERYVTGRDYAGRGKWPEAIRELTAAITIDPDFAAAYAQLGLSRTWQLFFDPTLSESELPLARAAIDRALEIDPTLPEAHLAQAVYLYRGAPDIERAAKEFQQAIAGLPNDAVAHRTYGYLLRHQGRWDEALAQFARAADLDPHSEAVKTYLLTLITLDRPDEAAKVIVTAQAARPDDVELALWPGDLAVNVACDLPVMEQMLARVEQRFPDTPELLQERWYFGLQIGDATQAVTAVEELARISNTPDDDLPWRRGLAYLAAGRRGDAEPQLRVSVQGYLARVAHRPPGPERASDYGNIALHYSLLGDRRQASLYVQRSSDDLAKSSGGAGRGEAFLFNAMALAHVGDERGAVAQMRQFFGAPNLLKAAGLWCDPMLAPLRTNAAFRELLAEHGANVGIDPLRRETWPKVRRFK